MLETISETIHQTERTIGGASLGSLFAQVCERHGGRTAVSFGGESITYAELNQAAGRVATALSTINLPPAALVAIYMERSIGLVAAMLGVIQAGAAYLPIDASYPVARVLDTLEDAKPVAILTERALSLSLAGTGLETIFVDELGDVVQDVAPHEVQPNNLAYVIYTSGSTGRPKGVMVAHRKCDAPAGRDGTLVPFQRAGCVDDVSTPLPLTSRCGRCGVCLLNGGRLVIVPFAVSRSPEDFYALLSAERVTVLNQTPSAFSLLIQTEGQSQRLPLVLRSVILGGEALNLRSLLPWFSRHGDETPEIVNMYGITETTVHVTYRRILAADAERETDSLIGEPIPDLHIYLLDDTLRPVAEGETGEICIGGSGCGAWLSTSSGADAGALCRGPVRRRGTPAVSLRRSCATGVMMESLCISAAQTGR